MPSDSEHTLSFLSTTQDAVETIPLLIPCMAGDLTRYEGSPIPLPVGSVTIGRRRNDKTCLEFPDPWMSSEHARFDTAGDTTRLTDLNSKHGSWINGKRCDKQVLHPGDTIELGTHFFRFHRFPKMHGDIFPALARFGSLTTNNPAFAEKLLHLKKVIAADVSILLLGATGVGKERLAQSIHLESNRSGDVIPVHCAAIPESMFAAQLFGHEKGAFSGATQNNIGHIRQAHQGTLFLDEVADIPMGAQIQLLRVLQEKTVTPLGGTRSTAVDFQLVTATHTDPLHEIERNLFREDLYGRIAGHVVNIPSLASRQEDLGSIAQAITPGLKFSRDALRYIWTYPWPRNIRELENFLRVASSLVEIVELPLAEKLLPRSTPSQESNLRKLLQTHNGNVSAVARELGKARVQIRRLCEKYNIDINAFRC